MVENDSAQQKSLMKMNNEYLNYKQIFLSPQKDSTDLKDYGFKWEYT